MDSRGFSSYTDLEEAQRIICSKVEETGTENVPFDSARGRVLDEDLVSEVDVPSFDRAAMDGFAVRAEDTFGAEEDDPNEFRVAGSIEIGSESNLEVNEKEAVRIATGAWMPEGSDSVVKLEETSVEGSKVEVLAPVSPGKNVSSRGEDVKSGETVLESGRKLRPSDLGLLAATGNLEVKVKKKPKVGIVATGQELREPGDSVEPGQIMNVNSYTLEAAVKNSGGLPERLGVISDEKERIREAFKHGSDFDVLIFTGGASVGEKDMVPDVMSELGNLAFHGVAMRPGSPSAFGIVNGTPVFSLPGFPAAAIIAFEVLVRPALRSMRRLSEEDFRPVVSATLTRKISSSLGRLDLARVRPHKEEGGYRAEPVRVTGSSLLSSISRADGFVMIPEYIEGFPEGSEVEVRIFD